ncbi:MAG: HAD family phosphatase [Verrucomicrobia bacterium]|nr:HAD family phosphatase [Verrucomicrobiota bacterium]
MKFGAIFDWDGVIIDSSAHHEASWERLAAETGLPLPPGHFKRGFGMKNEFIIPNLLGWTGEPEEVRRLSCRKEALYREIIVESGIRPLPGAVGLLDRLREAGVPCAVGSSTPRLNIETVLQMLGLQRHFQTIVAAEDVAHGKPDPEVFLKAAEGIRSSPSCSVVFEDAFVGIEAAIRGGMKVVAVATTNPLESLGRADLAVRSLDELELGRIEALFDAK